VTRCRALELNESEILQLGLEGGVGVPEVCGESTASVRCHWQRSLVLLRLSRVELHRCFVRCCIKPHYFALHHALSAEFFDSRFHLLVCSADESFLFCFTAKKINANAAKKTCYSKCNKQV